MTSVPKLMFIALTLLALPSCAELGEDVGNQTPTAPVAQQTTILPPPQQKSAPVIQPNFSCTGGLKFNASFSHDKRFAYIVFFDSAIRHKLRSTNVASGFEYSNGKLIYREYKGQTTLMDLTENTTKPVRCHRILTSKKRGLRKGNQ